MACSRPWKMYRPHVYNPHSFWSMNDCVEIPCGYCLNCRVDKRNQWSDRAKWEYKTRLTASFVTLTYDNRHIVETLYHSPYDDSLQSQLDYSHVRKFIQRLRKFVKYHEELHGVLCQPDFTYLYVGEYGEQGALFDRCHFHILFFGLDFAFMKKFYESEWKKGYIDSLPLLDGGINYVLKYMDKEVYGDVAEQKYGVHLLNKPKRGSSIGFGSSLYYDNKADILEHGLAYKISPTKRRPVPAYYKRCLLNGDVLSPFNRDEVWLANKIADDNTVRDMRDLYNLRDFSVKAKSAYKKRMAALRERKLHTIMIRDGVPAFDYLSGADIYFSADREKIKRIPVDIARQCIADYIQSIEVGDVV